MTSVTLTEHLPDVDRREVLALVEAATDADGVSPLSERVTLHLRHGGDPNSRHLLAHDGGRLVGYAHLDRSDGTAASSAELVVHPEHRGQGHGTALLAALLKHTSSHTLELWAHSVGEPARRLAARHGFGVVRELLQLRRSLLAVLPPPVLPEGIVVRQFRPGLDDDAWLALNALSFADHPEQGDWSLDDLRHRLGEPWFDPAGFFLAETDDALVGFHWTKVHGGRDRQDHANANEPIGEVYVVGVDPSTRGTGLGRALTLVGLNHLRAQGLTQALLYVDADNTAAKTLYTALGFSLWDTDVMFAAR